MLKYRYVFSEILWLDGIAAPVRSLWQYKPFSFNHNLPPSNQTMMVRLIQIFARVDVAYLIVVQVIRIQITIIVFLLFSLLYLDKNGMIVVFGLLEYFSLLLLGLFTRIFCHLGTSSNVGVYLRKKCWCKTARLLRSSQTSTEWAI